MNDLSDNEIIGMLISISGAKSAGMLMNGTKLWNWNGTTWAGFDALVDDALCFQLMVKYEVGIICVAKGVFVVQCKMSDTESDENTSLNKAICLAIIEAHKDN